MRGAGSVPPALRDKLHGNGKKDKGIFLSYERNLLFILKSIKTVFDLVSDTQENNSTVKQHGDI